MQQRDQSPQLDTVTDYSSRNALAEAQQRIRQLERELERSDTAVTNAIQQTFKAQNDARALAEKIAAIEESQNRAAEDWNVVVECDNVALKQRLETAQTERDRAMRLVEEIKCLLSERVSGFI